MGDASDVGDERTRTITGDRHRDRQGLYLTGLDYLVRQVPYARRRVIRSVSGGPNKGHTGGEMIEHGDAGRHTRSVVRQGQGVSDLLAGGELEGVLFSLARVCDCLRDRSVCRTRERPILRIVRHIDGRQRHIRRQGQFLPLPGGQITGGGVGLRSARRARACHGILLNDDRVIAGGQVLEQVVTVGIRESRRRLVHTRRRLVRQRECHAVQGSVRSRRGRTTTVIDVPVQGAANRAVGNQSEVNRRVALPLCKRDIAAQSVGICRSIGSRVGHRR